MFKVKNELKSAEKLMREAYCSTLIELAENNKNIVALDADLISSSGMKPFFAKFPDRAIQCGIAEANMIGVAAGLSLTGKIPFCHSFAPFASRSTEPMISGSSKGARNSEPRTTARAPRIRSADCSGWKL